jgi:NAD-dependent DNA ligase
LIVGKNAGSKLKKAEALNIEVIREAELDKFIN